MQIFGIKLAGGLKAVPIVDLEPAVLQREQPGGPQLLQGPVDVDVRQAESITDFGLRDRPRELVIAVAQDLPDKIRVSVRDSGTGIEPQNLTRVFQAFYTTKPYGIGIGLSISRSIIEAHGGRLWAVQNDGPGATFQFTLPTHAASSV